MQKPTGEELLEDYLKLAYWVASRVYKRPNNESNMANEWREQARLALFVAWDKFDWDKCTHVKQWTKYLRLTVEGEINQWVARNMYPLSGSPYGLKEGRGDFGKPVWWWRGRNGQEIDPVTQASNLRAKLQHYAPVYDVPTMEEQLAVAKQRVYAEVSPAEELVVEFFSLGWSDQEIADELELSRSQVQRIKVDMLDRIRKAAKEFYEEDQKERVTEKSSDSWAEMGFH